MKNGLFIFRRDLRIVDNNALFNACNECDNVYCCFIFTPEQITSKNKYKSDNAIQFMVESIFELMKEIGSVNSKLYLLYGDNNNVIRELIIKFNINAVYFNRDYTPYALLRDHSIKDLCANQKIECNEYQDYYLYEPGIIRSDAGTFYKKFTPFYNKALKIKVDKPININIKKLGIKYVTLSHSTTLDIIKSKFYNYNNNTLITGGRTNALKQLKDTKNTQQKYDQMRNMLTHNTSLLSAYIKFGCVSIREVYHYFKDTFGLSSEIMRQLIWRDFYAHVLFAYPNVLDKNSNIIRWMKNKNYLNKWCTGNTGYPVVDACMRQLNKTGWMHNRGRLITSCFLIKTLLLDWKEGETYYATKLIDYDVASNNGNWQWISGTGVDSMPYFRTFNPWTQSEKYDKDAEYIKKWVPELIDVEPKDIHNWNVMFNNYKSINYPKPIVEFSKQRIKSLELYKKYL